MSETILNNGTEITIAGETYTLRRLGLQDVFKVARILGSGVAVLGDDTGSIKPQETLQVLIASMTQQEDRVLDLVADLLNVDREQLNNPEKFPMDSIIDILQKLAEHQDLKAFMEKLGKLTENMPEMQTASREASTS